MLFRPAWYLNLDASSEVIVQVCDDRFTAHARTATPQEKRTPWPTMVERWLSYDEYQAKTERDIPLVVLERSA